MKRRRGVFLDVPVTSIVLRSRDSEGRNVVIKLRKVSRNGNVDLLAVDGESGKAVVLQSLQKEPPAMVVASTEYPPKRGRRIEGAINGYFSAFLRSVWGEAFDELNYPFIRVSRSPVGRLRVTLTVPYRLVRKIWEDLGERGRIETYSIHRITDPDADDWGIILYHIGKHAGPELPFILQKVIRNESKKNPNRRTIALQRISTAADAVRKAKESAFRIYRNGEDYVPKLQDEIKRFLSVYDPKILPVFSLAAKYLQHSKHILDSTPKKYRKEAMRDIVTRLALLEHYLRKAADMISADKPGKRKEK